MGVNGVPLLSLIKDRMTWLQARQRLIAQNVANADTPGFTPRDLTPFRPAAGQGAPGEGGAGPAPVRLALTQPNHIAPAAPAGAPAQSVSAPDSETRLDGNGVVLEEQMLKMAESRMAYEAAVSLYQKSMTMLRMAARPPGR